MNTSRSTKSAYPNISPITLNCPTRRRGAQTTAVGRLLIPHAMYVALAEALDAILVTTDRRLAAASGPTCPIEAIERP